MTSWRVVPTKEFTKSLRRLDRPVARRIIEALDAVAATGQPRSRGKALAGPLSGLWRYRVDGYRVLVELQDDQIGSSGAEGGTPVHCLQEVSALGRSPLDLMDVPPVFFMPLPRVLRE